MPESSDYVRVSDKDTGHRLTILRSELPNGNYNELKASAVNELGDPLPPEFNVNQGQTATPSKENS